MFDSLTETDYNNMSGPDWPTYAEFNNGNQPEFVVAEISSMFAQYKTVTDSVPSTFCVLPFYGMEYPSKTACCLMPLNVNLPQVKKDLLAGVKSTACNKCWSLEGSSITSDRQLKNTALSTYLDKNIEELFANAVSGASSVVQYKIDTSNTCNAACITCNSMFSTTWAKYEKQANITPYKTWHTAIDEINIDYETAACVSFRGGESMLSKTNFEILQKLIDANNTQCFVSFVTNGSVKLSIDNILLLQKFKSVNICVSIDGIDSVFEYMRYPLQWDTVVSNINYYKSCGFNVSASYTLSNLNVLYYKQTTEWFAKNDVQYLVNPVYYPRYFRPSALPAQIKHVVISENDDAFIAQLLATDRGNDDADYAMFLLKIKQQDSWKKINGKDYLPEFFDLVVAAGLEPA